MIRVRDEAGEHFLSVDAFEAAVRSGHIGPYTQVASTGLTDDRFVDAQKLPLFAAVFDPQRMMMRRHFRLAGFPFVTLFISCACVALFALTAHVGGGAISKEALLALGAKARAPILDEGQTWRLFLANLLHKDTGHLAFNLFAFLNVGTVLEGVYRRADYLLVLVLGGLSAMSLSLALSDPVTVGLSGVIFACLGAAVVFGLRFADMLPRRYRLYFGVVVVGYAAAMFALGLLRKSTDNWGHAGGLVAGVLLAFWLPPRMLAHEQTPTVTRGAIVAGALVCATVLLGPFLPRLTYRLVPHVVDAFGIELWRPATWKRAPDPLLALAFGNQSDALVSLACGRAPAPRTNEAAVSRFVKDELQSLAVRGSIAQLEVQAAHATNIDNTPAQEVPFSFLGADGAFDARAVVFVRGEHECALVLASRHFASARSEEMLADVRRSVRFVESKREREARLHALNQPNDFHARLQLAEAHFAFGNVDNGGAALQHACTATTLDLERLDACTRLLNAARPSDTDAYGRLADAAAELAHSANDDVTRRRADLLCRAGRIDEAQRLLPAQAPCNEGR